MRKASRTPQKGSQAGGHGATSLSGVGIDTSVISMDAGSAGLGTGRESPQIPMPFPQHAQGDGCRRPLMCRWSVSTVAPGEGGSEERFTDIILLPPRRLRVHVASEQT